MQWGGVIRIELREICCKFMDYIHLAQDMDQWQALAKLGFRESRGIS